MNTEPSLKTRRAFLQTSALGAAATWTVPAFLAETFAALHTLAADSATQSATGVDAPILVVLQMAGGNDGLNMIVPYANDHYHRARPALALPTKDVLRIDDAFGFHPAMTDFKALYDEGKIAIAQGVGYPNPNRSHFRSTEIWQTASDANRVEKHGWLGRYFDSACRGCDPTLGVSIGRQMPQAFAATKPIGVSLDDPQRYRFMAGDRAEDNPNGSTERFFRELNNGADEDMAAPEMAAGASISSVPGKLPGNLSPLDYLERTALDAQLSSDRILAVSRKAQNLTAYPASQLANSLKLVARLIGGGLPTRIYYVSQGGYDTHTNQMPAQQRLLGEMSAAIRAFTTDMAAQGNGERVVLMTFSEFGRRVAQNANQGTDHGAAAPLFLIGAKVKAGWHGRFPGLAPADLHNGDLKFTTDFRSIYAGVLEHWLRTPSAPVLGRAFPPVALV